MLKRRRFTPSRRLSPLPGTTITRGAAPEAAERKLCGPREVDGNLLLRAFKAVLS